MIREAKISDCELLISLAGKENSEEQMKEMRKSLTSYNEAVFIDYENEIPVGYAICGIKEEESIEPVGTLSELNLKPTYRNKGIDKRLLNKCENWAKDKGCKTFAVTCLAEDTQKIDFYNYAGFKKTNNIVYFSKEL